MWTPNDFYISRDFFNRELINFQVGFGVLRADSLWLDPLNKNTLLVTFSVSQQRYTRTTGTITLYISCVFAEEDGSWRKAAQSAAVPDSICPNLFHQASQPYQNQSLCAGVCDFYVPLWKMSGLLMTGSRASRNDFPRHVFHPFCRSNSYELSHLAAVAIGREWVALHVSRQSTDGTHGIHTFIIQQCRSSFYVKIDFEGHQHYTERTQIKVEL